MKVENKILKKYKAVTKRVENFFKADNEMQVRKVWDQQQKEIWINRVNKCPTCNVKLTKKNCTKEHIHPLVLGGTESDDNVTPMCKDCNKERNNVMIQFLGTTSHKILRSKWPENQEKINHFVIWCYVSLGSNDESRHFFTDLEQSFAKKRGIAVNGGSVKIKNQSKRWWSGVITIGQSLFSKANEGKEEIDKLEYKCLELSCQRTIYLPGNFKDIQREGRQLRCPHCKTIVGQSEIKKSANKETKIESECSDVKIDRSPDTKFNLEEWLSKNWQGSESTKEIYVKLKIAISEHEKAKTEPRNIRQVMHEDLGLDRNLSPEKIILRLDSIMSENLSKTESPNIDVQKLKGNFRNYVFENLPDKGKIPFSSFDSFSFISTHGFTKQTELKVALGYTPSSKLYDIIPEICDGLVAITEVDKQYYIEKTSVGIKEKLLNQLRVICLENQMENTELNYAWRKVSQWTRTVGIDGISELKQKLGFPGKCKIDVMLNQLYGDELDLTLIDGKCYINFNEN